jgi:hypothetical protein
MFYSCWWGDPDADRRHAPSASCGTAHASARACLEHAMALNKINPMRNWHIGHADGRGLTMAETDAVMSPEARASMQQIAREFHRHEGGT